MAASSFVFEPPPRLHFFPNPRPPPLPTLLSLFSTTTAALLYGPSLRKGRRTTTATALLYGPSLRKGRRTTTAPPQRPTVSADDHPPLIDRDAFARVFDVAALRVPASRCSALEARLRGHLLNWPRVRNIARVPGDDVEPPGFNRLLPLDGDVSKSVSRRLYGSADGDGQRLSAVLYRDELAKTFDCRGYMKFRNLARISRPARKVKKKKKEAVESGVARRAAHKNDFAVVRVVDEVGDGGEDMAGLLGEGFGGGGWRGSTRLLLLDERYANNGVDDLPESIKAVLQGDALSGGNLQCELVKCSLTLFYDYWPMDEVLEEVLPNGIIIPASFEIVGHIAHLNLRDEHYPYRKIIAQVVLDKNKPKIQTVVNKIDSIQNDYRTMQLEVLAGNCSLVTSLVENGIRFQVNLGTVYWNSRLATERQRLINTFTKNDVVCDVFAGVGPIAISAAKKVKYVYANDLNPSAVDYLEQNVVLNKLGRNIEVSNMDGRRFIEYVFKRQKPDPITQVVMNLPNDALEFLDAFSGIPKKFFKVTSPKIHVYGFSKADDPEFDFRKKIQNALLKAVDMEICRVRLVAPGKWMLCASFLLPEDFFWGRDRS